MKIILIIPAVALTLFAGRGLASDKMRLELCRDREAIERVYHTNRLGANVRFEDAMSRADIERLVDRELRMETLLRREYGVVISPELVAAEVQRIDRNSRAPELLARLKAALDNDGSRFARSVVRPIVVEREFQARFEADPRFNGARRHELEVARAEWLQARAAGASTETIIVRARKLSQATIREQALGLASDASAPQPISPIQRVLSVQLQRAGDISAILDTPDSFQVYIAIARASDRLETIAVTLPKLDWRAWLESQTQSQTQISLHSQP